MLTFKKNAKNKAIREHKIPSFSTYNLTPKKPCDLSSAKAFHKGWPWKKLKLNIITSTVASKYAALRSFGSSSIVGSSSIFLLEDIEFFKNLEVLISCSEKSV